jgi:hypothetical protein
VAEDLGIGLLSLGQGVAAFNLFMPSLSTVRAATPGDMVVSHDVRMGEIGASAVTLGIGGIIGWAVKSPIPVYIAAGVAVMYTALYETTLHKIRPVESSLVDNTVADASTPHVNRNESGSLRTPYPFGDEIHYDVDRNLSTMGAVGYPVGSQATVSTGEAGPFGVYETNTTESTIIDTVGG